MTVIAAAAAIIWLSVLFAPWRAWSTRERLDGTSPSKPIDLSDVAVLIPARDEAALIEQTLTALMEQGEQLSITVIDDQSEDATADAALALGLDDLTVVNGVTLPAGWSGKVWALEQGFAQVARPFVLLLDADITLMPGLIGALRHKMTDEALGLASVMVELRRDGFWARLLKPAFVYFFKLLYPFRLSNSKSRLIAAAAGGCIMVRTSVLRDIGGFGALKGALIDDCALARQVK